ncbi:hypothetical protein NKJ73_27295 [Mesorhizobium sp. M0074]|uniref:hypothetical protein n=1 Tax=Mesorhizobium sp. M0074 TaxID=2956869 RepID=UPI00333D2D91
MGRVEPENFKFVDYTMAPQPTLIPKAEAENHVSIPLDFNHSALGFIANFGRVHVVMHLVAGIGRWSVNFSPSQFRPFRELWKDKAIPIGI